MLSSQPLYIQIGFAILLSLLSGLLGVYIQKIWSARKPRVHLSSIGFNGGLIEINDELSQLSESCSWGENLKGYVQFNELLDFEQQTGVYIEKLERAKTEVDSWLSKNIELKFNKNISKNILTSCPYFHSHVIGSFYVGVLRRRSEVHLPISNEEELLALESIFEMETDNDDEIIVHMGNRGVRFPIDKNFGEQQKKINKLIAYSFLKGEPKNIFWLLDNFSSKISNEILKLNKLRNNVRNTITKNAEFSIEARISNVGMQPYLFSPRGVIELIYGENNIKVILEHRQKERQLGELAQLLNKQAEQNSQTDVNVATFLDKNDISPHILLKGNDSVSCNFVSIGSLGKSAEELINFYRIGGLKARAVFCYSDNKTISSESTSFSKSINSEKSEDLLKAANKLLKRT